MHEQLFPLKMRPLVYSQHIAALGVDVPGIEKLSFSDVLWFFSLMFWKGRKDRRRN
jgi:hypothetical protein